MFIDAAILILNSDIVLDCHCDTGISFYRSKPWMLEKIIGNCFVFRIYLSFDNNEDKHD